LQDFSKTALKMVVPELFYEIVPFLIVMAYQANQRTKVRYC